ncbi:MAG: transcriptional regulator [Bacteroidetes bacterium]|nr:transcriptional regulator [Bacteroidota bacterium]
MEIRLLKNEEDYKLAIKRFEELFDALADTPEGEEAELLSYLIEKYEDENFPIDPPDPIEAIKFRMKQQGLKKMDIASIIGYKSRVSEIFSKKRKLSLNMIRKLHKELNIPYEALLKEY